MTASPPRPHRVPDALAVSASRVPPSTGGRTRGTQSGTVKGSTASPMTGRSREGCPRCGARSHAVGYWGRMGRYMGWGSPCPMTS
jgi:hypothetical protein